MWHVDSTHNTLITTGNGGPEPTEAQVTLFYNGGQSKYRVEKLLLPGQQIWLDVGQLLRNQVPDSDGKMIPPDTMYGSYELRDLDHPLVGLLYEGKLVIDKNYGHAAYGCARCCGWGAPSFDPGSFFGPPDIDNSEDVGAVDGCEGDQVFNVADSAYDWSSSNTAVATLTSPTLHTVAPGTATGISYLKMDNNNARAFCPEIYYGAQQGITVQCVVPTSFTQTSGSGDAQGFLHFTYSWNSSDGNLNDLAACSMREYVTYPGTTPFLWPSPSYTAGYDSPFPVTNSVPASDGVFQDTHSYPGFQGPYVANSFTATQYYQYICPCANGGQPVDVMGPLSIVRTVYFSSPSAEWIYQASKSGVTASVVLP